MNTTTRKRLVLLFAVSLSLILASCVPSAGFQHLDIESRRLLAHAEVEKTVYRSGGTTFDVNASWTRGSGKAPQELHLPARVGDTTFPSGQTIETRFNTSIYDGSLRFRQYFGNGPVGLTVAPGFAVVRRSLEASSATAQSSETVLSPAFEFMMGGLIRFRETTGFEANTTLFVTNANFNSVSRSRLFVWQKLGSHIQAEGGYSWLTSESPAQNNSSVSTKVSGPSLGVRFVF